jgi:putative sigma-54 modulation protein
MNIVSIKATNMNLTDAIRNYVADKCSALDKLAQDFEPAAEIAIEVGKSTRHHNKGPYMRCEMNLTIPGTILRAEEEREDLYEAIDVAQSELKRQLVEHKDRLIDKNRGPRPGKE